MSKQLNKMEQWEQAWADYVFALDAQDAQLGGEDFVYWCGLAARRLDEAKVRLRRIDREFCDRIEI